MHRKKCDISGRAGGYLDPAAGVQASPTEDNPVQILEKNNDSIYQIVEKMPQYTGGESALMKYVSENIKYPEKAKEDGIQGRVFISFVVKSIKLEMKMERSQ